METLINPFEDLTSVSSYRTYEEWKPSSNGSSYACISVLTVPMRNGNRFLARVWIWLDIVLTVPMRNGNLHCSLRQSLRNSVLTVPMRNGNCLQALHCDTHCLSFLPYLWGMETTQATYVYGILSLVLTVPMRNGNFCLCIGTQKAFFCSYRTYEEWKPRFRIFIHPALNLVLTVPMRNGNIPSK